MKVYNVRVAVVALVASEDSEAAIAKLRARIADAGLVYLDDDASADAFESEPGTEADF